ncbi:MAG: hypothetical protein HUJ66_04670 [Oscillospiraceae bacterium]|nr:hypothetical protein [Oscillospiraceae bacterium]
MSKNKNAMTRQQEIEASSFFGKHVTTAKAAVLFAATSLLCLSPMLLGRLLYGMIPELIETGLRDVAGNDDSLPRWALIYAVPGLFFVLNTICHAQLFLYQRLQKLPPKQIRLLGRWIIPVIGYFFCVWAIYSAAGLSVPKGTTGTGLLSVLLLYYGGRLFDCEGDSIFALPFAFVKRNDSVRTVTHRITALGIMAAGLILCISAMALGEVPAAAAITAVVLLLCPLPLCAVIYRR